MLIHTDTFATLYDVKCMSIIKWYWCRVKTIKH